MTADKTTNVITIPVAVSVDHTFETTIEITPPDHRTYSIRSFRPLHADEDYIVDGKGSLPPNDPGISLTQMSVQNPLRRYAGMLGPVSVDLDKLSDDNDLLSGFCFSRFEPLRLTFKPTRAPANFSVLIRAQPTTDE